jgi:hypothetical protein
MSAASNCRLIGRWRIIEADLWGRDHLDLVEPAMIAIGTDGQGEIAFGALQAGLDLGYNQSLVHFTWAGSEEMDEVSGDGHAELLDDGGLPLSGGPACPGPADPGGCGGPNHADFGFAVHNRGRCRSRIQQRKQPTRRKQ